MKNKQDIENEVQQTLNSVDSLQQLEANAFLHAKIANRMVSKQALTRITYNKLMVRLAAVLCLFICINGISFYVLKQKPNTANTKNYTGADAFANAYGLNNSLNSY
ncbi:MAG: hypothetical protein ABI367_15090 [Mucilaginibacter sp.]